MAMTKWYVLDVDEHLLISEWDQKSRAESQARRLMEESGHNMVVAKYDHSYVKNAKVTSALIR
jgi:hypothetical protein